MAVLKRLTKRSDFLRVQRANIKYVTPSLVVQTASNSSLGQMTARVGFTASKKIGNAVSRNFAKRRMRALISRQSDTLVEATDYVVIARQAMLVKKFSDIEAEMIGAIHALNKKMLLRKADIKPNSST
ncbi:MAG: ribonuclease P protein component [Alphaproteobacteria bacterium]|nr:ribonuclease P protein component [Alphaproteobacteria bacterium]RCL80406.1 MAG: ribonuclease P protein component [SAR116 cluster bacterium]